MKPTYTYLSKTTRECELRNIAEDGDNKFWTEIKCPVCDGWFDENEMETRSEYLSCIGDKCRQVVSNLIMIDEAEYKE